MTNSARRATSTDPSPLRQTAMDAAEDQLRLALPPPPARLNADAFAIGAGNQDAVKLLRAVDRWPDGRAALIGEAGSGKTHLTRSLFPTALRLDARALLDVDAARAGALAGAAPSAGAVMIFEAVDSALDDASAASTDPFWEVGPNPWAASPLEFALLHLLNMVAASDGSLLLTARRSTTEWRVRLPDLATRLTATIAARIRPPDADLRADILHKLLRDRGVAIEPTQLARMADAAPADYRALTTAVAWLDAATVRRRRPTLAMIDAAVDAARSAASASALGADAQKVSLAAPDDDESLEKTQMSLGL